MARHQTLGTNKKSLGTYTVPLTKQIGTHCSLEDHLLQAYMQLYLPVAITEIMPFRCKNVVVLTK